MSKPWLAKLFLACAVAFAPLAHALAPPKGVEQTASVEGITEYRLPNGLRVLLFPDATKPTVTVNITYMVGSRHENYGETGMAHLLEHLLFKDTPTHRGIPAEMKKRGIAYNASTWLDRTNYFASFAADDATLDWLLALEADRMVNSKVAREDLDSEMTVVRNEMEAGENNPVQVLMSRMESTAHLWHNYGNSTIGARSDVENMPIERLQAFYRRHYRPDNATLLVAGRIDPARTLSQIAETFGPLGRPAEPLDVTYTREPTQDGEREVVVRRVGETGYIGVAYHVPAGSHPDYAAIAVLADILGDTPTGRLHKELVEPKLATQTGALENALAEPGMLTILAELPEGGDMANVEAKLIDLVEGLAKKPVTDQEVADAKRRFAIASEQTINDANRLAMALSESIAQGDWRLYFLQRDQIDAVTAADVNRVAAAYLLPSNRTLGRFIPTGKPARAEIPEAPAVATLVQDYKGREAVAAGEVFDPSPANIDARTERGALSNGTKLALLTKDTRGDTVLLNMTFRFGDEASVKDRSDAAEFAASLLTRGSKTMTREQIARRFDELKAQVGFSGGAQSIAVTAQTTREHLPALLTLIADLLRNPAFPETEFEQLRTQAITGVQSSMTEPQAIASNRMGRHFNRWPAGHPYHEQTFDEQIAALKALKLDDVRAFHDAFYGAGDGEIALVGDFDAAATKAQLEELFGTWTRGKPFARIANPLQPVEAANVRDTTPDKANAVILLRTELPLTDADPDYPALLVGNYVFGGGMLKSRLADRVRQQEGLSYSVGSQFTASPLDARAGVVAYAIAAPENIAKVEAAFRDEWRKLLADGITADELKDAVDGLLKARTRGRGEDSALVGALGSNAYLGRTMQWHAELDAKLQTLTIEQVNAALKKHYADSAFSVFAAGDWDKAK